MINKLAVVTKVSDGLGYTTNDEKYIRPSLHKAIKLCYELKHNFFITDYFYPEFIYVKNDYIHYGFLILHRTNFTMLENIENK